MELEPDGVEACLLGRLRELPRFLLHVVGVVDGLSGCVAPNLKFLAESPRRLEGSGRGLRQPCFRVLFDWRFFPGIEAERLGFVVGIFCGNRSLRGSFAGGSAVTACRGAICPRHLAFKEDGGRGRRRLPFPILLLAP